MLMLATMASIRALGLIVSAQATAIFTAVVFSATFRLTSIVTFTTLEQWDSRGWIARMRVSNHSAILPTFEVVAH